MGARKLGSEVTKEVFLYEQSRGCPGARGQRKASPFPGMSSRHCAAICSPKCRLPRASSRPRSSSESDGGRRSRGRRIVKSEQAFLEALDKDEMSRMAYWGIRFALSHGTSGCGRRA
jgi:hypothetical protein